MAQATSTSSSGNTKRIRDRAWCFTAWNSEILNWSDKMTYMIYGEEVCPKSGKIHYQGYVYMKNPIGLSGMKKLLGKDTHFEVRSKNSTNSQAIEYCKKENKYKEFGVRPNDNGIKNLKDKCEEYGSKKEFINNDLETYCKYRNGINDYYNNKIEEYEGEREVIWIYGPSGSGKSRLARMICKDICITYNSPFFDYNGEKEVIYDDFRASDMKLNLLLKITDRYRFSVNVKGSNMPWAVEKIVFTSILAPWDMYRDTGENMKQIKRRITKIIDLNISYEFRTKIANRWIGKPPTARAAACSLPARTTRPIKKATL